MKRNLVLGMLLLCGVLARGGEVHKAAEHGDVAKLRAILDKDPAQATVQDEYGKTPLHWAAAKGQLEVIRVLVTDYKVDVNIPNGNGGSPAHAAASQGQPGSLKVLLGEFKADANLHRKKDGCTPLHFAAFKSETGHFEAAKVLVEYGADVNAKNNNGATPLAFAQFRRNQQTADLLRQHGARAERPSMSRMRSFGGGESMD